MQTLRRRCLPLRKELALSSPGDNPRPVRYAEKLGLFVLLARPAFNVVDVPAFSWG